MEINMREIGLTILEMEKENFIGLMVIFMMEIGKIIENADLENIFRKIKINILVNGKMIKYKEKEDFNGIMEIFMMEIGIIIKDMDMVSV